MLPGNICTVLLACDIWPEPCKASWGRREAKEKREACES